MRFVPLGSGSSGNCTFLDSDTTHLLVDVGISGKRTAEGLAGLDLSLMDINGIFITHEHSDHISGLKVIQGKTDACFYATGATIREILNGASGKGLDPDRFIEIRPDERITIGDIAVEPMHIEHDAADPVGYRFYSGKTKACVCTDLGCYNDYTAECLKDSDVLLVEANHDVNMLEAGPYPYQLKRRILSDKGHLSNINSARLLKKILNDHMKGIYLGHLSDKNNLPELCYETVRLELSEGENAFSPDDLPIHIAKRREVSILTVM